MKRTVSIYATLLILFSFYAYACSASRRSDSPKSQTSYAMGSLVTQTVYGGDGQTLENAMKAIVALDDEISYRNDMSVIAELNENANARLSAKALELITQSQKLSRETDGKYDITVLSLVLLWGFDTDSPSLPDDNDIRSALLKTGYEKITINDDIVTLAGGAAVDLSAAGKGEACEVAVNEYKKAGITGGIVTVGGSVGVYGTKNGEKFTVGVRDPFDASSLLGTLLLTDIYISTSGSYEKKFTSGGTEYHHLLDTDTGYPVENGLISVTVICNDGGLSDMLASAFFCVGKEKALTLIGEYSAEAIFVTTDKHIYITGGLADCFDSSYGFTVISP